MLRREFLVAGTGMAGCAGPVIQPEPDPQAPPFLEGFETLYATDPREAARAWFRSTGSGLFLEYGVYSQLRRGPNFQFDERIPVSRYSKLNAAFDPRGFDPDRIAQLAVRAGMKHVGLTARHADGFCLFRTIETDFNSLESSGRDLVGELAEACQQRKLGLLLTYSLAADWRHPFFFPAESAKTEWRGARPAYVTPQREYAFQKDEDFLHYIRYAHNQLQEICYRYDGVAGIRLEPVAGYYARPDLFPIEQTYGVLREARPGILVSFGLGASGDEDFATTETELPRDPSQGDITPAWATNRDKPLEFSRSLASNLAPSDMKAQPRSAADLLVLLEGAASRGANLLVRVALEPDGSLREADERALLRFGDLRGA